MNGDMLNQWFEDTQESVDRGTTGNRKRIVCPDGFSISVQGSRSHYCSPRENQGPYWDIEVGHASDECPTLKPYQDGEGSKLFGYVPIELVEELLVSHGWTHGNMIAF